MSAPFVTQLRSGPRAIVVGASGATPITIRVEIPEIWDTVAVKTSGEESVVDVKRAALAALMPEVEDHREFMFKLKGWEILDERASLASAGVVDGSILLLTYRRRRAVR